MIKNVRKCTRCGAVLERGKRCDCRKRIFMHKRAQTLCPSAYSERRGKVVTC